MYLINDSLFNKLNKVAREYNNPKEWLSDDEKILVEMIGEQMFKEARKGKFETEYFAHEDELRFLMGETVDIDPLNIVEYFTSEEVTASYAKLDTPCQCLVFKLGWKYRSLPPTSRG